MTATAGLSRRRFLQGTAAACLAGAALPSLHPQLAFGAPGDPSRGDVLVLILLRGGMDGLSAIVPAGERGYYDARKTTAVPAAATVPLDGRFGLHPALAPLADVFKAGDLAVVPACGSFDPSRSHFDQQDVLERGVGRQDPNRTGWLGRHLATRGAPASAAIQSLAIGTRVPLSLHSAPAPVVIPDIERFAIDRLAAGAAPAMQATLLRLAGDGSLAEGASAAVQTLDLLARTQPGSIAPANGAKYEQQWWSTQLRQVGQLIRAGVGLEAAVLDFGGWDTHTSMGTHTDGQMRELLTRLGMALHSFYVDMLDVRDQITTVVISEFGRRVAQNGGGGTDHGHGGVAMVMGGGIRGGVYGAWPGLGASVLDRGDVPVATDFRAVLAEVVQQRLRNPALGTVFPGYTPAFLGLTA